MQSCEYRLISIFLRMAVATPVAGWITLPLWVLYSPPPGGAAAFLLSEPGLLMFLFSPVFVPYVLLFSFDASRSWFSRFITIQGFTYLLALALCYAATYVVFRQRRKYEAGHCPSCGYDLRAHAPGQLCPECAHPVPEDLVRKPMA